MTTTDTRSVTRSDIRSGLHDQDVQVLPTHALVDLVALAERYDAAANQRGLDTVRAEAERRADDQPADSLTAQVAGYIGLLTDDTEHALADEAHAWSCALRHALDDTVPAAPAVVAVPVPRAAHETAVQSLRGRPRLRHLLNPWSAARHSQLPRWAEINTRATDGHSDSDGSSGSSDVEDGA